MSDLISRDAVLSIIAGEGLHILDKAIRAIPAADARAEALKEAADALNERGIREQADFGLDRGTQNFFRARDLVRALIRALDDQREGGRDG